jgi:hypothetical protein
MKVLWIFIPDRCRRNESCRSLRELPEGKKKLVCRGGGRRRREGERRRKEGKERKGGAVPKNI